MRFLKSTLAVALAACLAVPSSAQIEAVVSVAGAARIAALPIIAAPLSLTAAAAFHAAPASITSLSAAAFVAAAPGTPAAAVAASAVSVLPAAADASPAAASAAPAAPMLFRAPSAAIMQPAAMLRERWERFWSGARARRGETDAVLVDVSRAPAVPRSAFALAATAAPISAAKVLGAHAVPLLGAGLVLAGAYGADRGLRWLIAKVAAKKDVEAHKLAAARLTARVLVWTGAVYGALAAGGASHQVMATALGAGGTVLTLGLRDMLGNVLQGMSFLIARPFTIGDRVQIDDKVGVVSDLDLNGVTLRKDDGSIVKVRHSTLAGKSVIVFGPFSPTGPRPFFEHGAKPQFTGAARAVWSSLDRGFWLAAAGFAAIVAAPHFAAVLAAGAPAKALTWTLAAGIAWLTYRVEHSLSAAVDAVAARNGWRLEARVLGRLAVRSGLWLFGGGAALRIVGLSWEALAASLGLTTVVVGFASNNFFGTALLGVETMFSRPFQIGDRVGVGAGAGVVVDMNFSYVVIQLDENRRLLVPYSVVQGSVLVVQPGTPSK